ncbi:unnamed protein product, partial [Ectocarpus sp. 8 AP-2014]
LTTTTTVVAPFAGRPRAGEEGKTNVSEKLSNAHETQKKACGTPLTLCSGTVLTTEGTRKTPLSSRMVVNQYYFKINQVVRSIVHTDQSPATANDERFTHDRCPFSSSQKRQQQVSQPSTFAKTSK